MEKKRFCYVKMLLTSEDTLSANRALQFCKSYLWNQQLFYKVCPSVLMYLNNILAERLCKGQYGAMFQQGISVKLKIPAGAHERESSGIC